jgi:hypothetical protein
MELESPTDAIFDNGDVIRYSKFQERAPRPGGRLL